MACPKGWEALTPLDAARPRHTPLLRDADGKLAPVDWPTALDDVRRRGSRPIQAEHGPESVAFLSTGQIPTEEMALLGAVAKFGMGMVHGDGNTRQCMATSVVAYKEAFGFDAPPYTYADFEESDVIVLVGSNLCIAHPIMWERVCAQPARARDHRRRSPRATETAMAATQHLAAPPEVRPRPALRPRPPADRSDGWIDRDVRRRPHHGLRRLRRATSPPFTPERVVAETGLSRRGRSATLAEHDPRRRAGVVLVDDGRQPEPPGRPHGAGDHQPGPA